MGHSPKMDVYSDHMVPFDLAAWCRGRKFNPKAVALAKALNEKETARAGVLAAERRLDASEAAVKAAVAELQGHIEQEGT